MKILTILGARPQFIKAATISRVIQNRSDIHEVIVHTGQHHDANMSDVFFQEMQIPDPKYHLGIGGLTHGAMTGRMIEKIEEVLLLEKPDVVLVYGDTNSTLAGALAAAKIHLPIVHVEAGLRSFKMNMPEEINRILTDRISTILCCPTQTAIDNLRNEGYEKYKGKFFFSGDVMLDAVRFYEKNAVAQSKILEKLDFKLFFPVDFYPLFDKNEIFNNLLRGFNEMFLNINGNFCSSVPVENSKNTHISL